MYNSLCFVIICDHWFYNSLSFFKTSAVLLFQARLSRKTSSAVLLDPCVLMSVSTDWPLIRSAPTLKHALRHINIQSQLSWRLVTGKYIPAGYLVKSECKRKKTNKTRGSAVLDRSACVAVSWVFVHNGPQPFGRRSFWITWLWCTVKRICWLSLEKIGDNL